MAELPHSEGVIGDRELEYIRTCLESELFPDRLILEQVPALDWERLFVLLQNHRLAAHFYAISRTCPGRWPASFCEQLRREHLVLMLYGDQCVLRVRTALLALRAAGIDVIVLKGWATIHTLYGRDYSQRFCEDVDILVRQRDTSAVEEVLRIAEFQQEEESWPGYHHRYTNGSHYFYVPQSKILGRTFTIGLHWGLLHSPVYSPDQIDIDILFERAHPLRVAGIDVLELSVEDQIVYGCAHLWLHHRNDESLFRYFELAWIIVKAGLTLDWQAVTERARAWHVILPVKNVVIRIKALWPNEIPSSALESLVYSKPTKKENFVDEWMAVTKGKPAYVHLLTWLMTSGFRRRLGIIFQDIFPGKPYMLKRYGHAPGGLWPLLYFHRFFRALYFLSKKAV